MHFHSASTITITTQRFHKKTTKMPELNIFATISYESLQGTQAVSAAVNEATTEIAYNKKPQQRQITQMLFYAQHSIQFSPAVCHQALFL